MVIFNIFHLQYIHDDVCTVCIKSRADSPKKTSSPFLHSSNRHDSLLVPSRENNPDIRPLRRFQLRDDFRSKRYSYSARLTSGAGPTFGTQVRQKQTSPFLALRCSKIFISIEISQ